MVKTITQEYFNSTLTEKKNLYSMTFSDALRETISHFEAQGVDLSNIETSAHVLFGEDPPDEPTRCLSPLEEQGVDLSNIETSTHVLFGEDPPGEPTRCLSPLEEQTKKVKTITQEYFNATYAENMEVFSLNPSDALQETIFQFEAQGVDLNNIVKSVEMVSGEDLVRNAIEALKHSNTKESLETLEKLQVLLKSDMAYKIHAGKMGTYEVLLDKVESCSSDNTLLCCLIKTLTILMDGYPDLLEKKGVEFIVSTLKKHNGIVSRMTFQWAYKCCLKHEKNRQDFMNAGIVKVLKFYVCTVTPGETLQNACYFIKALTFDDDIRHTISNAHRNACELATELLLPLSECLKAHMQDDVTACAIMGTISSLCVRNEFCEVLMKEGFLNVIEDCMTQFLDKQRVHTKAFMVLSSLAGNDDVKIQIILIGMGPLIVSSMSLHDNCLEHCIAGSNLVAALCLRNELISKNLFDLGCADIIMRNMKTHRRSCKLQMSSCRALRNMVSHNPKVSADLIHNNIEDLLMEVTNRHEDCKDCAKELLKQLGCKVQLIELWTGKEGDKLKC